MADNDLRAEVAVLAARVAMLETAVFPAPPEPEPVPEPPPAEQPA